jgi:hypothetical protein
MNTIVKALFLFSILVICSCNNNKEKVKEIKSYTMEVEKLRNENILQIEFPKIISNMDQSDLKNKIENVVSKIDKSLPDLEKKSKLVTLNKIQNTPVTIWYSYNKPIKIEHGVTDDAGKFTGVFTYYLNQEKVWFSNQIFAKYLFQDDKLKYWMNEEWSINDIPANDFKDQEKRITGIVNYLISELKMK